VHIWKSATRGRAKRGRRDAVLRRVPPPGKPSNAALHPLPLEATAQHGSPYPIRHIPERRARTCRLLIGTSTPYPNESTDLDFQGARDVSQ
jgi:hypothetical protein